MIYTFFFIILLYVSNITFGMELYRENLFDTLAKETTIKIAASLQPEDRNSLSWTCKEYNERFSKKNYTNILFQRRCILSHKDQVYYVREFAKKNNWSLVKNLIQNGQDNRALDIILLFAPPAQKNQNDINTSYIQMLKDIKIYKKNRSAQDQKKILDNLMLHIMNVYKGCPNTWERYICPHRKTYKGCPNCHDSTPFSLLVKTKGDCTQEQINRINNKLDIFSIIHPTSHGNTLLHEVLQQRNLILAKDNVKELIDRNTDVNATNNDGDTPTHFAVKNEHTCKTLDLFIKKGALLNITNKNGLTPLQIATRNNNYSTLYFTNPFDNPIGIDSSCHAKMLVENGANPNVQNEKGNTVLHLACKNGDYLFCRKLIEKYNADPNIKNNKSQTPLLKQMMWATDIFPDLLEQERLQAVKILIENAKTDLNAQDNNGDTAFHLILKPITCRDDTFKMIIDLLILKKAQQNIFNKQGKPPIHLLIDSCNLKGLKHLLAYPDVDVNVRDNNGNTPLHYACMLPDYSDLASAMEIILDVNPAAINLQNKDGNTPLHLAVINEDTALIDLLLAKNANPNIQNKKGQTPLHIAIHNLDIAIICQLDEKTDKTVRDCNGNTVTEYLAEQYKKYWLIEK